MAVFDQQRAKKGMVIGHTIALSVNSVIMLVAGIAYHSWLLVIAGGITALFLLVARWLSRRL